MDKMKCNHKFKEHLIWKDYAKSKKEMLKLEEEWNEFNFKRNNEGKTLVCFDCFFKQRKTSKLRRFFGL